MSKFSRLLVSSVFGLVLLGALALAATASAEVRTGEGSSPVNLGLAGEADLLHASASYDSSTGSAVVSLTTRQAPGPEPKVEPIAFLVTVNGPCDASLIGSKEGGFPSFTIGAVYEEAEARWTTAWKAAAAEGESTGPGPGSWNLEGDTVTIAATAGPAIDRPYNCAFVSLGPPASEPGASGEFAFFPLSVPKPAAPVEPAKPADPVVKTVTVTVTPPPAAPGKLAFAKPGALGAKSGKWTKASVKLTNSGGTAVGPISIKAKAPAGVAIKPGQMKLPALLPGQSWTVGFRVKIGATAKSTSTIALSATGPGLSADGSLVLKRQA